MIVRIATQRAEVDAAVVRLDRALQAASLESRSLKRAARALSPPVLLGLGLIGGFLLVALPRHLRVDALLGVGRFAFARWWNAWNAERSE